MAKIPGLVLGLLFALIVTLPAKGVPTKITVSGATLRTPIEITDPTTLKHFDVWSWPGTQSEGFIIQWGPTSLAPPPRNWPSYEVSFFGGTDKPIYIVTYQFNPSGADGYVYVPRTKLNQSTIGRGGMEDWWYRSSSDWERIVRRLIASSLR